MGKTCDGGRDLVGMELAVEYCDKRFLETCDIGRERLLLRAGGEVISGGRAGCAELGAGDEMAGGEVAGDEPGDTTAVMVRSKAEGKEDGAEESQWDSGIAGVGFAPSRWH